MHLRRKSTAIQDYSYHGLAGFRCRKSYYQWKAQFDNKAIQPRKTSACMSVILRLRLSQRWVFDSNVSSVLFPTCAARSSLQRLINTEIVLRNADSRGMKRWILVISSRSIWACRSEQVPRPWREQIQEVVELCGVQFHVPPRLQYSCVLSWIEPFQLGLMP